MFMDKQTIIEIKNTVKDKENLGALLIGALIGMFLFEPKLVIKVVALSCFAGVVVDAVWTEGHKFEIGGQQCQEGWKEC